MDVENQHFIFYFFVRVLNVSLKCFVCVCMWEEAWRYKVCTFLLFSRKSVKFLNEFSHLIQANKEDKKKCLELEWTNQLLQPPTQTPCERLVGLNFSGVTLNPCSEVFGLLDEVLSPEFEETLLATFFSFLKLPQKDKSSKDASSFSRASQPENHSK